MLETIWGKSQQMLTVDGMRGEARPNKKTALSCPPRHDAKAERQGNERGECTGPGREVCVGALQLKPGNPWASKQQQQTCCVFPSTKNTQARWMPGASPLSTPNLPKHEQK